MEPKNEPKKEQWVAVAVLVRMPHDAVERFLWDVKSDPGKMLVFYKVSRHRLEILEVP